MQRTRLTSDVHTLFPPSDTICRLCWTIFPAFMSRLVDLPYVGKVYVKLKHVNDACFPLPFGHVSHT